MFTGILGKEYEGKIRKDILERNMRLFLKIFDPEEKYDTRSKTTFNDFNERGRRITTTTVKIKEAFEHYDDVIRSDITLMGYTQKDPKFHVGIEINRNNDKFKTRITFHIRNHTLYHKFNKELNNILKEDFQFKEIKDRTIRLKMDRFFRKNNSIMALFAIVIGVLTLIVTSFNLFK